MDRQGKLKFRFHDPNDPNALATVLMHICVDMNRSRVERILEEVAVTRGENKEEERTSVNNKFQNESNL